MSAILEELELEDVCRLIWNGENEAEVYKKLKNGLDNWWNREQIKEREAIEQSTFSMLYKEMIPEGKGAEYLEKKVKYKECKEI